MKTLATIALAAISLSIPLAALPQSPPAPTPSPTPTRSEISDFRVPIGSTVIYGEHNGEPVRLQVTADGHLIVEVVSP